MISDAPGIFLALTCLVASTPLSLLGAFAIRRRMEAIAPDHEKQERKARRRKDDR
jgi:hypothetical protein